jgi:ribosome-associated translation inhibitor RaiA
MQNPLRLTFRGMAHSEALAAQLTLRVDRLEHFFDRIVSCHVVLDLAGHHHRHGDCYRVTINVGLPKRELIVSHTPSSHRAMETPGTTIDRAFDEAQRQLEDWVRLQRQDRHAAVRPARERDA